MNEVVKYHNDLNTVSMRGWNASEMNIFFGIIAKLRNQGTKEIVMNTDELRDITDTTGNKNSKRWEDATVSLTEKLVNLRYYYRDEKKRTVMNLFALLEVNIEEKSLRVAVTNYFDYILNDLTNQFTSWELEEFVKLKSSYSKSLYRLLKQWRNVGKIRYSIQDLRILLDITDSYTSGQIKKRIIENSIKELSPYFSGLKYKTIKENSQGTPIVAFEFTWKAEKTGKWIENKYKKTYEELIPEWMNVDGTVKQTDKPKNVSSQKEEEIREKLREIMEE